MSTAVNAATNFLNQNFYGFLLLLVAAFFFYQGKNEAAQAFSFIGSTLMGVRQLPTAQPSTTINTDQATTTVKTGN